MDQIISPQQAKKYCLDIANDHYENFPVVSFLTPKTLRAPIAAVYTFARIADDFADEGDVSPADRLKYLQEFGAKLDLTISNTPPNEALFVALHSVIDRYQLPLRLFHDLLAAFTQDVTKTRYKNFEEVLHYCQLSANPIGRILLCLYGQNTAKNILLCDKICTALQIINFLQDVHEDLERGRVYLPQDEINMYGITIEQISAKQNLLQWRKLMDKQINRVRSMMREGSLLTRFLKGRLRFNLKMTVAGGLRILEKLEQDTSRGLNQRLVLSKKNWLGILIKEIFT